MPTPFRRQRISTIRKVFTIILLPQIIFLWITSWILVRTESQRKSQRDNTEQIHFIKQSKCNSKSTIESRETIKVEV
jgi:hypothetical protein